MAYSNKFLEIQEEFKKFWEDIHNQKFEINDKEALLIFKGDWSAYATYTSFCFNEVEK